MSCAGYWYTQEHFAGMCSAADACKVRKRCLWLAEAVAVYIKAGLLWCCVEGCPGLNGAQQRHSLKIVLVGVSQKCYAGAGSSCSHQEFAKRTDHPIEDKMFSVGQPQHHIFPGCFLLPLFASVLMRCLLSQGLAAAAARKAAKRTCSSADDETFNMRGLQQHIFWDVFSSDACEGPDELLADAGAGSGCSYQGSC